MSAQTAAHPGLGEERSSGGHLLARGLHLGQPGRVTTSAVAAAAGKPFLFFERVANVLDDASAFGDGRERKQTAPRTGALNRKPVFAGSEFRLLHCLGYLLEVGLAGFESLRD